MSPSPEIDITNTKDSFSQDFIPLQQSETFLRGSFSKRFTTIIGERGSVGVRLSLWKIAIEYYRTDNPPTLTPFNGLRVAVWDRLFSSTIPHGWRKMFASLTLAQNAVINLTEENYTAPWSRTLKLYKNRWGNQKEYIIEKTSYENFSSYYKKHGKPNSQATSSLKILKSHLSIEPSYVHMYFLVKKENKEVVGGLATIDAPDAGQSYYQLGFLNRKIAPLTSGVWLLDNWFKECRERNLKYANLGLIWSPGKPESWKGFTAFKLHFRPIILKYKTPLFRVTFYS